VLEQLAQLNIKPAAVILEPQPRGTAAAIGLATLWADENGVTDPLIILPADHLMGPPAEFQAVLKATQAAAQKHIVLFGITPNFAQTEFGYIQHGPTTPEGPHRVARFVEKPTRAKAQEMLKEGGYSWNSGIFTATPATLRDEFNALAPNIWQQCARAWQQKTAETLMGTTLLRPGAAFAECPNPPFDTAVMENTAKAVVIPYTGRWSDIGNFASLAEALPQDPQGNTSSGNVALTQTHNSFVHASVPGKVVAVHGLDGAVVVDTPDALLVTTKSRAAEVKSIFNFLQQQNAPQVEEHARVVRPWGWYQTIASGPGFLVKRIGVNPGGRLSLQYHHHRAEHWVITHGRATVTNGENTFELGADESTYIPQGAHHRLENKTQEALELVEVQTGARLEESDIVRLDDVYNRTGPKA